MGIGCPSERLRPHFPQPARGAGLLRCTHGARVVAEDTPLNGHETEGQLGVTEVQQVAAGREISGSKLPENARLESELLVMRTHPVSRIATVVYEW